VLGAQHIPIRTLTRAVSTSPGAIKALNGIRHLRDGRVLVNDAGAQRLLVFDSTLARFRVVAENSPGARNKYGAFPGRLMPYVAIGISIAHACGTSANGPGVPGRGRGA
jgi:hypothetical protein